MCCVDFQGVCVMCDLISAEFIQGVSQFSVKGEKEKKLRCEWHTHTRTHCVYTYCHTLLAV